MPSGPEVQHRYLPRINRQVLQILAINRQLVFKYAHPISNLFFGSYLEIDLNLTSCVLKFHDHGFYLLFLVEAGLSLYSDVTLLIDNFFGEVSDDLV